MIKATETSLLSGDLSWCRFYVNFAHNIDIQALSEVDQRRYLMLLLLKTENQIRTNFSNTTIAHYLNISAAAWKKTRDKLIEVGIIDFTNHPTGWEFRQRPSDSGAKKMRAYRARKKDSDK